MGVAPDGTGTGWDEDSPDIDQPHGKDYITFQHIMKAVRLRIAKEHVTFADTTAGGEHMPGKCGVMLVCDDTADFTAFVDATTAPLGAIAYCITHAQLWCITATASGAAPDFTVVRLGPLSICLGDDFTWDGAHLFDASCDFSDVAITGDFTLAGKFETDGTVNFNADVNFAADASFDGTVDFADDVAFVADVSVDGTAALQDTVITGDSTFTFDAIAGETGPTFKVLGDWSAKSQDTTYTARTDGWVVITANALGARITHIDTPAGTARVTDSRGHGNDRTNCSCFVKGGDTWAACIDVTTAVCTVYFIPIGDNT